MLGRLAASFLLLFCLGMSPQEEHLIDHTNHAREVHGLPILVGRDYLGDFGALEARRMARTGLLEHSPRPPETCVWWGENIAHWYDSLWSLHQAFMDSLHHRLNILNGNYTRIGVGIVEDGDSIWVAIEFC